MGKPAAPERPAPSRFSAASRQITGSVSDGYYEHNNPFPQAPSPNK